MIVVLPSSSRIRSLPVAAVRRLGRKAAARLLSLSKKRSTVGRPSATGWQESGVVGLKPLLAGPNAALFKSRGETRAGLLAI
jgi:hypothetical protein